MYAWKFHRWDKFIIQSVTGGIREYNNLLILKFIIITITIILTVLFQCQNQFQHKMYLQSFHSCSHSLFEKSITDCPFELCKITETFDKVRLNEALPHFYINPRKTDRDKYKVNSLENIGHSLSRYLQAPPFLKTFDLCKITLLVSQY
jgi:hypothetical protein